MGKKALISWALYDWANSAFAAVVQTFLFAAYFTEQVAPDQAMGTWGWGMAMAAAGFSVAIMAPLLGAMADQTQAHRRWVAPFTLLCIVCTAGLWFVRPDPSCVPLAMILIALASYGSEMAFVFYNAMLPHVAPPNQIGRWSAWGYSLGYFGGLLCLGIALLSFVLPGTDWHGADRESAEHIRLTFPLVSLWYAVFALPLFLFVPTGKSTGCTVREAFWGGVAQLSKTASEVSKYSLAIRFLIARMLYADALSTTFLFGGVLAAGVFGMSSSQILLFGIVLNVVAGIGSACYALFADHFHSRKVIISSLIGLIVSVTAVILAQKEWQFWIAGICLGILVGPIQAASRAYLAAISPPKLLNQMFGFFALSGKATSWFGPLAVGWITLMTGSQRIGISVVLIYLVCGLGLILTLRDAEEVA